MDVLVVDDDAVDTENIVRLLKKGVVDNYTIDCAANVEEGLCLASQKQYDLILLDYRMPGRDGIELILALRKGAQINSTAIVMMSSSENENLALAAIRAGAQDFLVKSEITPARLHRAILHAQTRFELELQLYDSYQKVKSLAETDPLTGLSNRYLFDESLKMAVANNRRNDHKLALVFIDLDNFKFINDTYGHDVGDALLKAVVRRFRSALRGNEICARLGGDEFALILTNLDSAELAGRVAKRVLTTFERPFELHDQEIRASASIGVAIYPDNARSTDELIKYADIAMYRAKKMGRNQICMFEENMQKQFSTRYLMEQQLSQALSKDQFMLYFQPLLNPMNMEVVGMEALIRWEFEGQLRFPGEFIPVAEGSAIIHDLGLWVFQQALAGITKASRLAKRKLSVSVNLSAKQFEDKHLVERFETTRKLFNFPAELIELELTETALMSDVQSVKHVLVTLSELGYKIALDDFGTGFSSVSHLQTFPIDTVKIDRSIVPDDINDKKALTLFQGLVSMLQYLDLQIVAEGVEVDPHAKLCIAHNINRAQGYFYSKPDKLETITNRFFNL